MGLIGKRCNGGWASGLLVGICWMAMGGMLWAQEDFGAGVPQQVEQPAAGQGMELKRSEEGKGKQAAVGMSWGSWLMTVGGCLTLAWGAAWLLKRWQPAAQRRLPTEVLEVLGRSPWMGRQELQLLRLGQKLLLVAVTPGGSSVLAEVNEQGEVERLTRLCRPDANGGISFAQVLQKFHTDKPQTTREAKPIGVKAGAA